MALAAIDRTGKRLISGPTGPFGSLRLDTERRHALIGPTRVDRRDGIVRLVRHLAADALTPDYRG